MPRRLEARACIVTEAEITAALPRHSRGRHWRHLAGEANDVWGTDDERFVVRIAPLGTVSLVRPEATVHAARLLQGRGVPAIRLVEDHPQPFKVSGRSATLWYFCREERPATPKDVAYTLATLHSMPLAASQLPARDLRPVVQGRLEQLRLTQPERSDYWMLLDRCRHAVEGCLNNAEYSVVHGDMRSSNVLISDEVAVLADLDSVSFAPRLFDTWRFGVDRVAGRMSAAEYAEFCHIARIDSETSDLAGFVSLIQLAFTTLAELRLASEPAPRWAAQQKQFERWWRRGANVAELPGWDET